MNKHWKYLSYVVRHKWFVFQAGRRVGASWWRLLKHDWSKFMPCEWVPYVEYFYGAYQRSYGPDIRPNEEANEAWWYEQAEDRFNMAWLHHQHVNDHHWQHWMLRMDDGATEKLHMPERVAREMVADWMGAGRAITGRWEASEWYEKNKDKIQLHAGTRAFVEELLAKAGSR